jgi:hypothetical protein
MPPIVNIKNVRFGRLTALRPATWRHRRLLWECRCDCGKTLVVDGNNLRRGHTRSCGCFSRESLRRRMTTHGKRRTAEYSVWRDMWTRCTNPNGKFYQHYGGRGIRVCNRWKRFENFLSDMGLRPDGLTLERKNTNGNYTPSNCKWATRLEQNRNRRNCKIKRKP